MDFKTDQEVLDFLKENTKAPTWVLTARENNNVLRALVKGEDFDKHLINKIDKIESKDRAAAREKYAKDIRSVCTRLLQPRSNVFNATGATIINDIKSERISDKLEQTLRQFKGQKSIKKYLSETYFGLRDIDPNGMTFTEYKNDEEIYPTYKSIQDITNYETKGQIPLWVIFNPVKIVNGNNVYMEWRFVTPLKDYRIKQEGDDFTIIKELTFSHPFGRVPAIVLSEFQETGSELRISPLFDIVKDLEDYAHDKSILTIYKYTKGFPHHWRYVSRCRPCQGTGKSGINGDEDCKHCGGSGTTRRNDVTDITEIDFPEEGDPVVAPDLAGFNSPDIDTWQQYKEDLKDLEDSMTTTMWGVSQMRDKNKTNETATGRHIDVQPLINKLTVESDSIEWVHNQLTLLVESWVKNSSVTNPEYKVIYGRGYIVESTEVLLNRYNESRKAGANNTILDKELQEYINSKYQNNSMMMNQMSVKAAIEPYVHLSIIETSTIFGSVEANKKIIFNEFWQTVNKEEEFNLDALRADFKAYFNTNNEIKPPEPKEEVNK